MYLDGTFFVTVVLVQVEKLKSLWNPYSINYVSPLKKGELIHS